MRACVCMHACMCVCHATDLIFSFMDSFVFTSDSF